MHAYYQGLDGEEAAWANKKYRGHRVLPDKLMDEIEKRRQAVASTESR
jgi:hypothetical protein